MARLQLTWIGAVVVALAFACSLVGCGTPQASSAANSSTSSENPSGKTVEPKDGNATDQMWSETRMGETIDLFCFDGRLFTVDRCESVNAILDQEPEDGKFYRIVADVTYLNGGVAGYVDYPEIKSVESSKEIAVSDLGLPSVTEKRYGLTLIGDYADGDVFLCEYGNMAVWKDGSWVYRYDKSSDGKDGTLICRRDGVTDEDIEAGVAEGVLSCADYFVAPAIG